MAARQANRNTKVIGLVRSASKGRSLVEAGLLDEATDQLAIACKNCQIIVVATPVDRLANLVIQAAQASPEDSLITDVGSTKTKILQQVLQDELATKKFVAAHPIAGSEKSGALHSTVDLFVGKPVVITPSDQTPTALTEKCREFWRSLGGNVFEMSAEDHDATLAAISHVPHLVSSLIAKQITPAGIPLVGTGWKDVTRVAGGDPEMWTAICATNRRSILHELDRFRKQTDELRELIATGDDTALLSWLEDAKQLKEQTEIQPD